LREDFYLGCYEGVHGFFRRLFWDYGYLMCYFGWCDREDMFWEYWLLFFSVIFYFDSDLLAGKSNDELLPSSSLLF
jgi:hypothetical protein